MRLRRVTSMVVGAVVVVAGLGACEPPPARTQLTVTSTAAGADGDPGDGVCSAPAAGGACTLQAAVDEANAVGPTDVALPAGVYRGAQATLSITGDLTIRGAGVATVSLERWALSVADGASLHLVGVGATLLEGNTLTVAGFLHMERSTTGAALWTTAAALTVTATGSALVQHSLLGSINSVVATQGSVVLASSTLNSAGLDTSVVHRADGAGLARWTATAALLAGPFGGLGRCAGTPPESYGYNRIGLDDCELSGTGDTEGLTGSEFDGGVDDPPTASSPLVDAIPLGVGTCTTSLTDMFGRPRGGDGNGDGIPGCDIGAVERQPASP